MIGDLIRRLREREIAEHSNFAADYYPDALCIEAADAIAALLAERDALRRELAEETERAALAKQLGTEPACTAERCTIQNYHSPCLRQTRLAERDYDRPTRYTRGLKAGQ